MIKKFCDRCQNEIVSDTRPQGERVELELKDELIKSYVQVEPSNFSDVCQPCINLTAFSHLKQLLQKFEDKVAAQHQAELGKLAISAPRSSYDWDEKL